MTIAQNINISYVLVLQPEEVTLNTRVIWITTSQGQIGLLGLIDVKS